VAANASSSPPGSSQQSFADAAEDEDTVLTGSPVVAASLSAPTSSRLGDGSPGGALAAAAALPVGISIEDAPSHAAALAAAAAGCKQQEKQGRDSMRLPREAVRQRVWSFQAIPQGTASIPSKGAAAVAAAAGEAGAAAEPCSASGSARPAFFTRAGPPAPGSPGAAAAATAALPLQAAPAAAKAAGASGAVSAARRRQQRLEQLSRPRHLTPRYHHHHQRGAGPAFCPADALPAPAAPEQDISARHAEPGSTKTGRSSRYATGAAHSRGIAAWHPAQQQATNGTGSGPAAAAAGAGSTGQWPQRLGSELSVAELQRATGAYSEERFQQRMAQLNATLAARQAQRCQVSDATAAGDVYAFRKLQLGAVGRVCCARSTVARHV
jgi:hypothetical protein